jgi:hypothetical protein
MIHDRFAACVATFLIFVVTQPSQRSQTLAVATFQPSDNLIVNAMYGRGQVLVFRLRPTVADDDMQSAA